MKKRQRGKKWVNAFIGKQLDGERKGTPVVSVTDLASGNRCEAQRANALSSSDTLRAPIRTDGRKPF